MSELALAVFASETGTHLVRAPSGARWAAHLRSFDARGYEARLAAKGLRFVGRTSRAFPPLLRAVHDPPPGLFLRGRAEPEVLSQPAVAIVGARACSASSECRSGTCSPRACGFGVSSPGTCIGANAAIRSPRTEPPSRSPEDKS